MHNDAGAVRFSRGAAVRLHSPRASPPTTAADEVFTGEGEVALAMLQLGATPEQLDQESERIRSELFTPGAQ